MRIFCLLTLLTCAARAADPFTLAAPDLVRDIAWSVPTTAEWQGAIAAPSFPAANREHHGKVIHRILSTHAASPTAQGRRLFSAPSTIADGNHRHVQLIFTDQPNVVLREPETGTTLGSVPFRGLPVSGFALSRRGSFKQYLFIVVWVGSCLVNPADYSPRANAFLFTWINLAIQLNGYMDHHLSTPLPLFIGDRQGLTRQGAQERGSAAEVQFLDWLRTWDGLNELPDGEKQWLARSPQFVRTTVSSTISCPLELKNRRRVDEN